MLTCGYVVRLFYNSLYKEGFKFGSVVFLCKSHTTTHHPTATFLMCPALSIFPPTTHHHHLRRLILSTITLLQSTPPNTFSTFPTKCRRFPTFRTCVEHFDYNAKLKDKWDFYNATDKDIFNFESGFGLSEMNKSGLDSGALSVEVKELEELPEQWRRSKLAWLCKELPAHKQGVLVRVLNAQREWVTQEDATYLDVIFLFIA